MNLKLIPNFISLEEAEEIKSYRPPCTEIKFENEHIRKVNEGMLGWSSLCDLSNTHVSKQISEFQGDSSVVTEVPKLFDELATRISETLKISREHCFVQCIQIGDQGRVGQHYDAGMPGFITYKCNIFVHGTAENDGIYVDRIPLLLKQRDLYCFEANFYKHWMPVNPARLHLSYGFIIPYETLKWKNDDPRVKLSNRIWKAFMSGKIKH